MRHGLDGLLQGPVSGRMRDGEETDGVEGLVLGVVVCFVFINCGEKRLVLE